jgi:hypothetical protein
MQKTSEYVAPSPYTLHPTIVGDVWSNEVALDILHFAVIFGCDFIHLGEKVPFIMRHIH